MPNIVLGNPTYLLGNTSRLLGVPVSTPTTRLWSIEIDWDNDNGYSGENEAVYCIDMDIDRGFLEEFATSEEGYANHLAPPMVGRCTLTMENVTGRYNLWNSDGSPSTTIMPGRMARIRVREGYSSTDNDVFAGIVKDIKNNVSEKTATIVITDGIDVLQNSDTQVSNMSLITVYDQYDAIQAILADIDWRFGDTFETGIAAYTIPYFSASGKAFSEIAKLTRLGSQYIYCDAANQLVLGTAEAVRTTSTDPVITQYDADIFHKDIELSQPWENVFTDLWSYTYEYNLDPTAVLWQKGDADLLVAAGSSTDIYITYTYNDATVDSFIAIADALVSSSDFIVNTAASSTGTDITASCSVALTDFATNAKLTLTNSSTDAGYFTTLQVRGTPIVTRQSIRKAALTNWVGIDRRIMKLDTPHQKYFSWTGDNNWEEIGYPHTTKHVQLKITTRAEQFLHDINDILTFNITKPYIAPLDWDAGNNYKYNQFRLMRIRHKWQSRSGQDVLTVWDCRHTLMPGAPTSL